MMGAPKIVCFGNLTLDDVVQRNGILRENCLGGDALYGVLAARLIEPSAEMVAPTGHDFPGDMREMMLQAGLSPSGMPERPCPTLHTHLVYETADKRVVTLLSDPADFETLSPKPADVPQPYWGAQAFMVLAMTLQAQAALIAACRARGTGLVGLDPQEEYIDGNEQPVLDLIAQADVFMPSLAEVAMLLGHENAEDAARAFASLGPRIVVIKMGAQGCLVYDARKHEVFRQAAMGGAVVDTTGCGDAFCAAFMATLVQPAATLRQAAANGAAAASVAMSSFGVDGLMRLQRTGK
jgi:ribokinase